MALTNDELAIYNAAACFKKIWRQAVIEETCGIRLRLDRRCKAPEPCWEGVNDLFCYRNQAAVVQFDRACEQVPWKDLPDNLIVEIKIGDLYDNGRLLSVVFDDVEAADVQEFIATLKQLVLQDLELNITEWR